MANILSFESGRKFYGDEYYPYGLDRSGQFTRLQAELLIEHGWAYQELESGTRLPETDEEEAFVAVCRGKRKSRTEHEQVWMLYREKTSAPASRAPCPLTDRKSPPGPSLGSGFNDDFESSAF